MLQKLLLVLFRSFQSLAVPHDPRALRGEQAPDESGLIARCPLTMLSGKQKKLVELWYQYAPAANRRGKKRDVRTAARALAEVAVHGCAPRPRLPRWVLCRVNESRAGEHEHGLNELLRRNRDQLGMRGQLRQRLRRIGIVRQGCDDRPVDLLLQRRFPERAADLHRNIICIHEEHERLLPKCFALLQRREPAVALGEYVAPELLVDEIVAHGLPQHRMTDAGKKLLAGFGKIDSFDMVEEVS